MGSLMQDFKRQASFFLREKIKTARLVLTDVTPAQLLAEEVINGDSLATDVQAMRLISRAAFEVDDYERIVHILHNRLCGMNMWNWRASYKALVLLEHLLTHGPKRIAEEFEADGGTISIRDMATNFHYVDDKGFNWGLSVKSKAERVMKLIDDKSYLKEERARGRKLTLGIKGFGSFNEQRPVEGHEDKILRSKSLLSDGDHHYHRHAGSRSLLQASQEYGKLLVAEDDLNSHEYDVKEDDHPFWNQENQARVSLLSSV